MLELALVLTLHLTGKNMNIVVLGGGSAGWLTALLAREFYWQHTITVVESDEVGIAGVGESTTPPFISVLDMIRVPVSDLVRECGATLKTGIRFENWNGDNKSYFHPFYGRYGICATSSDVGNQLQNVSTTLEIARGEDLTSFAEILSQQCRSPFSYSNNIDNQGSNPILQLQNHLHFALHFNTRNLALYLRKLAESRNIVRVEGKLKQVITDDTGNITQLTLENGNLVDVDFVFDCSGFARLLIGKHFGTAWNSYKKHLPMKAARPFFVPHNNENIRPDTACIAMKYGWMWQIPVEDRYGCGYVFDSDYINGEQALVEVEEMLGYPVDSTKSFAFDAGNFESAYVKNCMAVGLAQGFIEPLESTSIMINCMNTVQFLKGNGPCNTSEKFRDQFNKNCRDRNKEVMDFVHLHYHTKRQDSEFWRNFKDYVETPDAVSEQLELWSESAPGEYNQTDRVFPLSSWMHVAHGLGLLNQDVFKKRSEDLLLEARGGTRYAHYRSNLDNVVKSCLTHQEFLNYLKTN